MKNSQFGYILLILIGLTVSGCAGSNIRNTGPTSVNLNKEGDYVNPMLDPDEVAIIKMRLPSQKILDLAPEIRKIGLPLFYVGGFPDETGFTEMKDSMISKSTSRWVRGALVNAGIKVVGSVNDYDQQAPFVMMGRMREYVNPQGQNPVIMSEESRKKFEAKSMQYSAMAANMDGPIPDITIIGAVTRFDPNIRSGLWDSGLGSAYDIVAASLGFQGRYQVSEMEMMFEVWNRKSGTMVMSFSLSKQIIANEKSFVLLSAIAGLLDDDIDARSTSKIRCGEPIQGAQKAIAEEGVYCIVRYFYEEKKKGMASNKKAS